MNRTHFLSQLLPCVRGDLKNRGTWASTLCRHAAVLAHAMGERVRQIHYEEMALPFARDWRFEAYNFAQLLMSDGQIVRAERYASSAYELSISSESQADRDLAAAILKQWPDAAPRSRGLAC